MREYKSMVKKSITLKAPAKINLFLDVIRKRNDGYHDIVTVFERINICDDITVSKKATPGISVACNGGISEKDNLAYEAARALFSKNKPKGGVHIKIRKRIPIAGGLGGGSSDVAATLIGMNRLFGLGYKKEDLADIASSIGADVPFFITGKSFAIGRDRGDRVSALPFRPSRMWHLLIFPGVKKLSRDVYGALRLNLTKGTRDVKMLLHALEIGDLDSIKRATYNRLEDPALYRDPGLSTLKSELIKFGMEEALLAGSGPTIFSLAKTRKEAVLLKERILQAIGPKAEGWQMFVASTL